jgi:hypothetical protein
MQMRISCGQHQYIPGFAEAAKLGFPRCVVPAGSDRKRPKSGAASASSPGVQVTHKQGHTHVCSSGWVGVSSAWVGVSSAWVGVSSGWVGCHLRKVIRRWHKGTTPFYHWSITRDQEYYEPTGIVILMVKAGTAIIMEYRSLFFTGSPSQVIECTTVLEVFTVALEARTVASTVHRKKGGRKGEAAAATNLMEAEAKALEGQTSPRYEPENMEEDQEEERERLLQQDS